jgi:hypothetical protein
MPPDILIVAVVVIVGAGLVLGQVIYAFIIAHGRHAPECEHRGQLVEDAKQVGIEIDDLTGSAHA